MATHYRDSCVIADRRTVRDPRGGIRAEWTNHHKTSPQVVPAGPGPEAIVVARDPAGTVLGRWELPLGP